jgi:hypothetical protein
MNVKKKAAESYQWQLCLIYNMPTASLATMAIQSIPAATVAMYEDDKINIQTALWS